MTTSDPRYPGRPDQPGQPGQQGGQDPLGDQDPRGQAGSTPPGAQGASSTYSAHSSAGGTGDPHSPHSTGGTHSAHSTGGTYSAPHRGGTRGFFDSLRGCGILRSQERWVGGVAGGLARRLEVDPTLVRCVWIVASLFSGVGLVVYGLAWALLPDESDGEIQVEGALAGHFSAPLAGAVGTVLVGLTMLDGGVVPGWYAMAWGAAPGEVLWSLFWLGVLALVVVGCVNHSRSRRRHPSQSPQYSHDAPNSQYTQHSQYAQYPQGPAYPPGRPPETPADHSAPAGPYPGARPGVGPQQGPRPGEPTGARASAPPRYRPAPQGAPAHAPRPAARPAAGARRAPGRRTGLIVLGLSFLAVAVCFLAIRDARIDAAGGLMVLGGALMVILGAGIISSALRRRHGGWMSALGVPALMLALPALVVGTALQPLPVWQSWHRADLRVYTWQDLGSDGGRLQDLGHHGAGNVLLDLRDMPPQADGARAIEIGVAAGDLEILTHPGRSIRVTANSRAGTVTTSLIQRWSASNGEVATRATSTDEYTLAGQPIERFTAESSFLRTASTLVSPEAQAAEPQPPALAITATISAGQLRVTEVPQEVTWSGDPTQEAWVIDSWTDEDGKEHPGRGLYPVPGMEHAAIGTDVASSCLQGTRLEDVDESDAWERLDELSATDRERYRACVARELQDAPAPSTSAPPGAGGGTDGTEGDGGTASPEPSAPPTR